MSGPSRKRLLSLDLWLTRQVARPPIFTSPVPMLPALPSPGWPPGFLQSWVFPLSLGNGKAQTLCPPRGDARPVLVKALAQRSVRLHSNLTTDTGYKREERGWEPVGTRCGLSVPRVCQAGRTDLCPNTGMGL